MGFLQMQLVNLNSIPPDLQKMQGVGMCPGFILQPPLGLMLDRLHRFQTERHMNKRFPPFGVNLPVEQKMRQVIVPVRL